MLSAKRDPVAVGIIAAIAIMIVVGLGVLVTTGRLSLHGASHAVHVETGPAADAH